MKIIYLNTTPIRPPVARPLITKNLTFEHSYTTSIHYECSNIKKFYFSNHIYTQYIYTINKKSFIFLITYTHTIYIYNK